MSGPDLTLEGAIRHSPAASGHGAALPGFLAASLAVSIGVWVLAVVLTPAAALPALVPPGLFAVIAAVAAWGVWACYPHGRVGACNLVTLIRAGLISILTLPLMAPDVLSGGAAWGIFWVALLAFLLDGLDGWLARRSGLSSGFGARFDMEVDAVFAALLALIALSAGQADWWVLGLGAMRYAFVAAGWALPWMRAALPERFRRKVVCVIQIGTLIALLAPLVQPPVSAVLAGAALAVLVWSFALDILWLWRNRGVKA